MMGRKSQGEHETTLSPRCYRLKQAVAMRHYR